MRSGTDLHGWGRGGGGGGGFPSPFLPISQPAYLVCSKAASASIFAMCLYKAARASSCSLFRNTTTTASPLYILDP